MPNSFRLSAALMGLSLLALIGCGPKLKLMILNAKGPETNLTQILVERKFSIYREEYSPGHTVAIHYDSDDRFDRQRVIQHLRKQIAAAERVGSPLQINLNIALFRFTQMPTNISFSPEKLKQQAGDNYSGAWYSAIYQFSHPADDSTVAIICDLKMAGHEIVHHAVKLDGYGSMGGQGMSNMWYQEGLAEYIMRSTLPEQCPHAGEERVTALRNFSSTENRKNLWRFFPAEIVATYLAPDGAQKRKIMPFGQDVIRGYQTAWGAFLYMEAILGQEKLLALIKSLDGGRSIRYETFYRKLERGVGHDLRTLSDDDVLRIFKEKGYLPRD